MGDIHDDLREVMGLLGKATDVRWLACERGSGDSDLWFDPYEDWCSYEDQLVRGAFKDADAQAIAAAVNFLRQHGPALLARQEGEDAERYRWLAEKIEAMDADDTMEVLSRFGMTYSWWPGFTELVDAARSGGGG